MANEVRDLYERFPYPAIDPSTPKTGFSEITSYTSAQYERCGRFVPPDGATILIVGCGTGADLHLAHNSNPNHGKIIGVDISKPSLEMARQRIEKHGLDNCEVAYGNISDIGTMPDYEFDFIISYGVLHHIRDANLAMYHIKMLLAKNGVFSGMVYNKNGRRDKYAFKKALARLGIIDPTIENVNIVKSMICSAKPGSMLHRMYFQEGSCLLVDGHIADDLLHPYDHPYDPSELREALYSAHLTMLNVYPTIPCHWDFTRGFSSMPDEISNRFNSLNPVQQWDVISAIYPDEIDRIEFSACRHGDEVTSDPSFKWVINPNIKNFCKINRSETSTSITLGLNKPAEFNGGQKQIIDMLLDGQMIHSKEFHIDNVPDEKIESFFMELEKFRFALQVD